MRMLRSSLPWFVLALLASLLWATGCKTANQTAPANEIHGPNDGHDHEAENAEKASEAMDQKAGKQEAKSVAEAKESLDTDNPDVLEKAIKSLTSFLNDPDPKLQQEAENTLLDLVKNHKDAKVRVAALQALAIDPEKYEAQVLTASRDSDLAMRMTAVSILGRSQPGGAAEKRLRELNKDSNGQVQQAAMVALSALLAGAGNNELIALVAELGNPNGDAAATASIALKLRGADALPILEKTVKTGKTGQHRHAATMCVALICAGTNASLENFASSAQAKSKDKVKPEAANLKGLPILIAALNDPEPMVREIAAQGLGYLGSEKAAKPLAKALTDKDKFVRRRAAAALVAIPSKQAQPAIERVAINDPDEAVRRFAVEALGWGDASVMPTLSRCCRDKSPMVRRYAAIQVGRAATRLKLTSDKVTLKALTDLFKDRDADVRWAAVQSVAAMRDPEATEQLVAALNDPVPQVSNAAEAGLQKMGIAKRVLPGAK